MNKLLIFCWLLLMPIPAAAADVDVHRITEGSQIESMLNEAVSRATTEISDKGTTLELTYSSPAPLHVIVLFLNRSGNFNPLDALVTTLPAGVQEQADIALSRSGAWAPGERNYRLHFLGTTSEGASFQDVEFTNDGIGAAVAAGITQLISPLPYTPSSFHRVASYKVWNIAVVPVFGVCTLLIFCIIWQFYNLRLALFIAIILTLLFQIRSVVDATSYAATHTTSWVSTQQYATAGSLPEIGKRLQELKASGVLLCSSGTSYPRRVLQYHSYPVALDAVDPSHAVVHKSTDWSYQAGILRCENTSVTAKLLETLSDGSTLYQILRK